MDSSHGHVARQEYRGGWPLGYTGAECPAHSNSKCTLSYGFTNLNCCPSGQTCLDDVLLIYCCPTSRPPLSLLSFPLGSRSPNLNPNRSRLQGRRGQPPRLRQRDMGPVRQHGQQVQQVLLLPAGLPWRAPHRGQLGPVRDQRRGHPGQPHRLGRHGADRRSSDGIRVGYRVGYRVGHRVGYRIEFGVRIRDRIRVGAEQPRGFVGRRIILWRGQRVGGDDHGDCDRRGHPPSYNRGGHPLVPPAESA